ncbi:MAG: PAS domain-containing protein [Chlorobiales bacterium]|nr:PAS domain-containing protein [Chlorobiales bacterium]
MIEINEPHIPVTSDSGFSQRLREYILKRHGSINSFCRTAGIKYPAQMTPYLQGRCHPGKKMIERLKKDGADIEWLQSGYTKSHEQAPLSTTLALSRYRVEIDNLYRKVLLHPGRGVEMLKPEIEAYAVIDHAERLVDITGSIETFLGYEKNALSNVGLISLIHPDDYVSVQKALQLLQPGDDIVSLYSRFKTGDGTYILVEWCLFITNKPMSELNEYSMILRRSSKLVP